MRAWIWMKCCVLTDVGTWTNWLTFQPDPDHSPDARTRLLSPLSYKQWDAEFYVGKIQRVCIDHCSDMWFYNGFIHWASEPSKHLCRRYMRSTECPSSSRVYSCFYVSPLTSSHCIFLRSSPFNSINVRSCTADPYYISTSILYNN